MGALILPVSGRVYVDANTIIYTVEKHPVYEPVVRPLWPAALAKILEVVSSDLVLLETLVGPIKKGDSALEQTYVQALSGTDVRLLPITQPILRTAARLRATTRLKTPDSIHAATAADAGCVLFVTNDVGYRGVPGLSVVILDDLLKP